MRKCLLLAVFCLLISSACYCTDYWKLDYSKVDSLARQVKPTSNLKKLAHQLTEPYDYDLYKYRSLFTWIAHNIQYDCKALYNSSLREIDPVKVIKNRKAVCAGYSSLFQELCKLTNLECETIEGWASSFVGNTFSKTPNHSWSAIKINGEWYLCDVTWAAGFANPKCSEFTFRFEDSYFCTPPELLVYNHYPKEDKWFLGSIITKDKFINGPFYFTHAVQIALTDLSPNSGTLPYEEGKELVFKFKTVKEVRSISIKPSNSKYATTAKFTNNDNEIEFTYIMDKYTPYLYVFINNEGTFSYKLKKAEL